MKTTKKIFKRVIVTMLITIIVTLSVHQPTYAASTTVNMKMTVKYDQTEARAMLPLINEFRKSDDAWCWNSSNTQKVQCTGLKDLTYDYGLEQIAMQRAAEIAVVFDHTRPNEEICFTCTYNGVCTNGENIAAGFYMCSTKEEAFELWQETNEYYDGQGHRRSMLSSSFTTVGIARVEYNGSHYWVQEFGCTKSSIAQNTALNANKDVTIPYSSNYLKTLTIKNSTDKISVIKNQITNVPEGLYNLVSNESFPGNPITVTIDSIWTVDDASIATISNNVITGKTVGSTKIRTTVLGKEFVVDLTVLNEQCVTHTYDEGKITSEPSCLEDGEKTYTCTKCGHCYTETANATGHAWANPVYSWSSDGSSCKLSLTCLNDSSHVVSDIAMKLEVDSVTPATCISTGSKTYKATVTYDNKTYTSQKIITLAEDPSNHPEEKLRQETEKSATCTESGYTEYIMCTACNKVVSGKDVISPLGHDYTKKIVNNSTLKSSATYDSPAVYYYSCSKCEEKGTNTFQYGEPLNLPENPTDVGINVDSADRYGLTATISISNSNINNFEFSWYASKDGSSWIEIQGWTLGNATVNWTPDEFGTYTVVGKVRSKGYSETEQFALCNFEYHPQIKGKCQMPYSGEQGNGYLIGVESYDNPEQKYKYEMLILDCTLLAQGLPAWTYTTGKFAVPQGNAGWCIWTPQYGYYWTLFRVYDENGVLIDEQCYGFQNIC